MRSLVIVLAAGLTFCTQAQDTKPAPAPTPAAQPPAPPPPPPAANAIPVPDGPVVSKQEIEGMLVEDIKIGDGYEVKPGGAVVALYHGTLKNGGTVFESSFDRGEPTPMGLTQMIPGWQKGVPGMKVGGVRRLTIPAALAFGPKGPPGSGIPDNADLVFVIQVLDAMKTEDVKVGTGEEAAGNCIAVTTYTITDADGKEIEKADASKPYIWLPGEYQPILLGVEGMKTGGKRKLVVPKEMNVSPPQAQSTRPQNVPVTIEVELLAVRNLPRRR